MAKFNIVENLTYMSRSEWVAGNNLPRLGRLVPRESRTHVIVHHTVTPDSDSSPNIWETEAEITARMRALQTVRHDLGLDVPYNFVAFIMADGRLVVCEGRGEDRSGAHTVGHNTAGIGIAFAGNFHDLTVTGAELPEKMKLLSYFIGWLKYSASHPDYGQFGPMPNLDALKPGGREVFIHQDLKPTDCPGQKIIPHLSRVSFLDPRQ